MIDGLALDHVGIAVPELEAALHVYERLTGHAGSPIEVLDAQGVRVAFVGDLELLEPLTPDAVVGRFLDRHGAGLHHLAFRTHDLEGDLERLQEDGFELVDQQPRRGARGHLVVFLHPRSTGRVLVELVQINRP